MSSTDAVDGVQETRAQAYARALEVWGQWLRQWRRTGGPRGRSARHTMRVARTEQDLDQTLAQIRRDEQAIKLSGGLASGELAAVLADDPEGARIPWTMTGPRR